MSASPILDTWPKLQAYLARCYQLIESSEPGFIRFPYSLGDGTSERVGVFHLRAKSEREWVAFALKIGPTSRIRAHAALIKNFEIPIGALCFANETLIVRHALPLQGFRLSHLEKTLAALAATTLEVRAAHDANVADGESPFAYLIR